MAGKRKTSLFAWLVAGLLVWIVFANFPDRQPSPVTSPTQASRKTIYVTGNVVNVREGPSTRFPVVAKVNRGQKLTELSHEGNWIKIALKGRDDKVAWIHSSLVSSKPKVISSGEWITILTVENRARLCPRPNCGTGQELLRIATNTKLRVLGSYTQHQPIFDVTWYKVKYQKKEGWVSEFNTDKARDVTQRR